ncbi:CobW family GTP-binding protein [Brachybacterium saurashtrense]|uniref:Cobalamin biosynthesis protein CobW n=1 Tax=Brachybacterium saurashtrense TaxID=556288 RepID=A0A345YQD6_9MICO|nr:GTP-binding protein [Brachybacterium saurashtrense]AXK46138.1 cobalamin biosynthesis protein CobW [Brachybacterium saurashtrense]RRR23878.1 cobalamin biosynthesis protein CobW [Brachybacterium saurashtrense]
MTPPRVPVIALTGFLGAGKTTVLNSILRAPGARFGVAVNDFGAINVDAALITGQIDEAASIAGGCLCCMPESDELDRALETLSDPRLRLDAILVEASGVAEPLAVSRLVRFSAAERTRPGGVIEMVDALSYFDTVDRAGPGGHRGEPPARFAAASLVVLTKTALLADGERERVIAEITARIRLRSEEVPILEAPHGRIDPELVADIAQAEDPPDQLPLAAVTRQARAEADPHQHVHADAVTVRAPGPVDAGAVLDLFESPPPGVYRLKGTITVSTPRGARHYVMHLVGRHVHVASRPAGGEDGLVAIGMDLDAAQVRARLAAALQEASASPAAGLRRLIRLRRLSE